MNDYLAEVSLAIFFLEQCWKAIHYLFCLLWTPQVSVPSCHWSWVVSQCPQKFVPDTRIWTEVSLPRKTMT